jgi:hypothetical protein
MGDVARLESRLHSLYVMPWYVSLARRPVPLPPSQSPAHRSLQRAGTLDSARLRQSYVECLATTAADRREGDLVCMESVYQAYVAICRAEGWPTRLTAPALGKRAFP